MTNVDPRQQTLEYVRKGLTTAAAVTKAHEQGRCKMRLPQAGWSSSGVTREGQLA